MMNAATANTTQASEASVGKRLLVLTMGSRGDIQPFAALCCGLRDAGFVVRVLTGANHIQFLQDFGLDVAGSHPDTEQWLMEDPETLKLMADGNFIQFARNFGEYYKRRFPSIFEAELAAARDFKPDMILSSGVEGTQAGAIAYSLGIPFVQCNLQVVLPSKHDASVIDEPMWLPGWVHMLANHLLYSIVIAGEKDGKYETILKALPDCGPTLLQNVDQFNYRLAHSVEPMLFGVSPLVVNPRPDWPMVPAVGGFWVVSKKEQECRMAKGDQAFGGLHQKALEAFLASGPAPVYMGWGSMLAVSAEHMSLLAVRSLKLAGKRGVVLGGWAKLSSEKLEGQPDSQELQEYAAKNVLFVPAAAHEWLFPQCSVLVHHGGAGTTAAALRSGRPCVVTPCGFDQFLHARTVQISGAGLALPRMSGVKPEDLAAALDKCTDQTMIKRCAELGAKLEQEDGVGATVQTLDKFMREEVVTGEWARKSKEFHKHLDSLAKSGVLKRLANSCSFVCCR